MIRYLIAIYSSCLVLSNIHLFIYIIIIGKLTARRHIQMPASETTPNWHFFQSNLNLKMLAIKLKIY